MNAHVLCTLEAVSHTKVTGFDCVVGANVLNFFFLYVYFFISFFSPKISEKCCWSFVVLFHTVPISISNLSVYI